MVGSFLNPQKCIDELIGQGFEFYMASNCLIYYYSQAKEEIAEINIHTDGSASVLIGRYSLKTQL